MHYMCMHVGPPACLGRLFLWLETDSCFALGRGTEQLEIVWHKQYLPCLVPARSNPETTEEEELVDFIHPA